MEAAIYRDRKRQVECARGERRRSGLEGNTLPAALLIRSSDDSSMSLCPDLRTLLPFPTA
jgi:hypothetical protein